MRLLLRSVFCVLLCGPAAAQKVITIKQLVVYHPIKEFFERNKEVRAVHFSQPWKDAAFELEVVKDSLPLLPNLNAFQLRNPGDRYFFETEYGRFHLPDSLYERFRQKMKGWVDVSGTVRQDSVFFTFEQTVYSNEDEKVFIKIESRKDYEGGLHLFAKELENALACLPVPITDSVLLFWTFLDKNRKMTVREVRLGDGTSVYTNAVRKYINASDSWIPYEKDGHYMRSYQRLYIRRYADGSYRVAMD